MSKQPPKFEQCNCPECRAAEALRTTNEEAREPSEAVRGTGENVYYDYEFEVLRSRYNSKGS